MFTNILDNLSLKSRGKRGCIHISMKNKVSIKNAFEAAAPKAFLNPVFLSKSRSYFFFSDFFPTMVKQITAATM